MARFTEWNEDLERALAEPFARELHEQKGGKGTFVSWEHYVRRLNELVGVAGWTIHAPLAFHAGNKLGLAVGVTILGVTRWDVGDEMEDHGEPDDDGKVRDYGSSCTNAFAQALKRACSKFGLGLYMYDAAATRLYLAGGGVTLQQVARALDAVPVRQQQAPVRTEARDCPKCNGPMWDNRESKKNPKQPDFKCKDKACDGVVWPPKQKAAPVMAPSNPFEDDDEMPF